MITQASGKTWGYFALAGALAAYEERSVSLPEDHRASNCLDILEERELCQMENFEEEVLLFFRRDGAAVRELARDAESHGPSLGA